MKSRETLIRLKRFHLDEKRRQVTQIEMMVNDFERMISDLDREVQAEQERAGVHDPSHYAYPTYARAARTRKENMQKSADDLKVQLEQAREALADAFEDMKKVELLDERDKATERSNLAARERTEMDRIAASQFSRA